MLNFELPVGLVYDGEVYREVETKFLTGRVIKELSNTAQSNRNRAHKLRRIALTLLVEDFPGIDERVEDLVGKLYEPDVDFILYKVAEDEFLDEDVVVTRTCEGQMGCGQENRFQYDLSEFPVIDLHSTESENPFAESEDFTIPFELSRGIPTGGRADADRAYQGRMGFLTLDQWEEAVKAATQGRGQGTDLGGARFNRIYHMIKELEYFYKGGEPQEGKDLLTTEEILNMRKGDFQKIEDLYDEYYPGPQFPETENCKNCGNTIQLLMDPIRDFIL